MPSRRQGLLALAATGLGIASLGLPRTALALPARALQFPRDFGSHPDLQTEWWYITGQLQAGGKPWGFQLTFSARASTPPRLCNRLWPPVS